MGGQELAENPPKRRMLHILGLLIIVALIVFAGQNVAKSSLDEYARSQAYPIYPNSTHVFSEEQFCYRGDNMYKCRIEVHCTQDDVSAVIAFLRSANLKPESLDGSFTNTYRLKRDKTLMDVMLYYVAGEANGSVDVLMLVGKDHFLRDQNSCVDQTVIFSQIQWTPP